MKNKTVSNHIGVIAYTLLALVFTFFCVAMPYSSLGEYGNVVMFFDIFAWLFGTLSVIGLFCSFILIGQNIVD